MPLPTKLNECPLIETVFEMRFKPTTPGVGNLLPGLLYAAMKSTYQEVETLSVGNVPREIRENTPDLKYKPTHRLRGKISSINTGDRIVSLFTRDYPGWTKFKPLVDALITEVNQTGLIKHVERFSIKYTNLFKEGKYDDLLSLLNLRVEVMGRVPREKGFHLRCESEEDMVLTILQISPGATVKPAGGELVGMIVNVDTIRAEPGDEFMTAPDALLEQIHAIAKKTFFSLVTEDTIKKMRPE